MPTIFTQEEINKLKEISPFSVQELHALATGEGLSLGLYRAARDLLGQAPLLTLEKELEELMTKVFLMFTILERKKLISLDEMRQMRDTLEEEGRHDAEGQSKAEG